MKNLNSELRKAVADYLNWRCEYLTQTINEVQQSKSSRLFDIKQRVAHIQKHANNCRNFALAWVDKAEDDKIIEYTKTSMFEAIASGDYEAYKGDQATIELDKVWDILNK